LSHTIKEAAMPKHVVSAKSVFVDENSDKEHSLATAGELLSSDPQSDKAEPAERNVRSMLKFTIIQDWRGEYRWQLISHAGQVLAVSGGSYPSTDAVMREVNGMRPGMASAPIEIALRVAA
jgi:uncharacterized protein YegP (UPF0339 family)